MLGPVRGQHGLKVPMGTGNGRTMQFPRRMRAAAAVVTLMVLAGCSPAEQETAPPPDAKKGGSATVIEANVLSSFNPASTAGNTDLNLKIGHATHSGFFSVDKNAAVVRNESFGRIEKISDDPLRVRYTVSEGVQWSDGDEVGAGDLLLSWAANSGYYDDVDAAAKTGTRYFTPAASTGGLGLTALPEMGEDGRSITLTYAGAFVDWETAFDVGMPAHVVAAKSGLEDEDALIRLLQDAPRGNRALPKENAPLQAVASFWNAGFESRTLPEDPALYLSNGPYIVQDLVAGESVTLIRNRDFTWGAEPYLDQITVRSQGSPASAVEAVKKGDADAASVQVSAATGDLFQGLNPESTTTDFTTQWAYDHLDLNFSGVFADRTVREAFLKAVPRQDIADAMASDSSLPGVVLDSQVFFPTDVKYQEAVESNGSAAYGSPDVQGSRELLNGATPTVRILYNRDSPNRVRAFGLIRDSASSAGFNVVDGGLSDAEWGSALGRGSYDASLLGWISTGAGVSRFSQIFRTGAGSNFTAFSDPSADLLLDQLAGTSDEAEQDSILAQLDKKIWSSAYGLPLYQSTTAVVRKDSFAGVESSPGPLGIWQSLPAWYREAK